MNMPPSTRTRKFTYKVNSISENEVENLKSIDCKYHIFGFKTICEETNEKSICGFIYFKFTRSMKTVKKLLQIDNVNYIEENAVNITDNIREMESIWETGEIPKKSKFPPSKKSTDSDVLTHMCSFIMKQHQQLIEDTMTQRNQLLQENIKLRETTLQLQQINKPENTMINSNNNITKNSNNKTFNINVFLNEECKNAITLVDFIKTLQVENDDLLYAKSHGFAEAVTRVLENGLKKYDITTRPMHCTDIKRETMHIKEDSGWTKESGIDSKQLNKAILSMSKKNMDKAVDYMEENSECEIGSRQYEQNLSIMQEIATGASEKYNKKIIKNIAKTVYLNEETTPTDV